MAQIAQQDNLVIEVTTTAKALDGDTKKKLIECIEAVSYTHLQNPLKTKIPRK